MKQYYAKLYRKHTLEDSHTLVLAIPFYCHEDSCEYLTAKAIMAGVVFEDDEYYDSYVDAAESLED